MRLKNGFSPYPDLLETYNSQRFSQHLVIRSDYRKYYPTPLPETAVLKKPEGRFWNVKWTIREDGIIRFEDGWPKFVKDNGVLDGDFLLFMYDSFRTFWVNVYRNGLPVKPKDPINIQEISDDEEDSTAADDEKDSTAAADDDDDDEDYGDMGTEEDSNENKIISLSLGSSDEDDVNAMTTTEVNRARGILKGGSSQSKRAPYIDNPEIYLDDQSNPCFISNSSCKRPSLVIAKQVIRDYELKFGDTIKLIDQFGEFEGKVKYWKDRTVVYNWDEIYKRNNATSQETIICEILREEGVVRSIKVHFVKN